MKEANSSEMKRKIKETWMKGNYEQILEQSEAKLKWIR